MIALYWLRGLFLLLLLGSVAFLFYVTVRKDA